MWVFLLAQRDTSGFEYCLWITSQGFWLFSLRADVVENTLGGETRVKPYPVCVLNGVEINVRAERKMAKGTVCVSVAHVCLYVCACVFTIVRTPAPFCSDGSPKGHRLSC